MTGRSGDQISGRCAHPSSLEGVIAVCADQGARLSGLRRPLLEAIWEAKTPATAYSLMAQLEELLGRRISPPTIYRALDFLISKRLIVRLESRNAYLPSPQPMQTGHYVFFTCDRCNNSSEIENPELETLLRRDARSMGFHLTKRVIEARGLCRECRAEDVTTEQAATQ